MRGNLIDRNLRGHVECIRRILESPVWHEVWSSLSLEFVTLEEAGLTERSPDDLIWRTCQSNEWCLITGNRNSDGPDSLQKTIERENFAEALPVFTIGDPDSVISSRDYADRVVVRLLEFLLVIDGKRGTGRRYLP